MSLFGSMTTAISGLTAQSRALGNISDNVANSQTVGYKRVDTNFVSYITDSNAKRNLPGSVQARPDYQNSVQGTPVPSDNPLALAIAGGGFFSVARPGGTSNGQIQFDDRQFYTRAGDFRVDQQGYLVNRSGYYLEGWGIDASGDPDRTQLQPIRINDLVFNPIASSRIDMSANLPANWDGDPITTPIPGVYDGLGTEQEMSLTWSPPGATDPANAWTLQINGPNGFSETATVTFGGPPDGTISSITLPPGSPLQLPADLSAGNPASIGFGIDFGQGVQTISLNLGTVGGRDGVTQFDSETFELRNLEADGVPLGSFSSVSIRDNGDVAINYSNGQTRIAYRVPLVSFSDPDALQRVDGQAFMRTIESGEARLGDVASNGAGRLAVGSVEGSNVDIASEFSKLIVAQRAYTANTRIVTTVDEMLTDTINMRR